MIGTTTSKPGMKIGQGGENQPQTLPLSSAPPLDAGRLQSRLDRSVAAGRFMVACFRVEGKTLHLDLDMRDFPHGDFPEAVRMLREQLSQEMRRSAAATLQCGGGKDEAKT